MKENEIQYAIPPEAIGKTVNATVSRARFLEKPGMALVEVTSSYEGQTFQVERKMFLNSYDPEKDRRFREMLGFAGIPHETFLRDISRLMDLERNRYELTIIPKIADSGKGYFMLLGAMVERNSPTPMQNIDPELLRDTVARLQKIVFDMEAERESWVERCQVLETTTNKLTKAYDRLRLAYNDAIEERNQLRRKLGMGHLPDNAIVFPEVP